MTAQRFQFALFSFSWSDLIHKRIPWFWQQIEGEWTWPLILLALVGIIRLFRSNSGLAWLLCLSSLIQAVFVINYDIPDIKVFFIPLYFFFAVFLAMGWQALIFYFERWPLFFPPFLRLTLVKVLMILSLSVGLLFAIGHYSQANMQGVTGYDQHLNCLFASLDPDQVSLIISSDYHESQFINYKLLVEYPNMLALHFDLNPREPFLPQIKRKINREVRTNRRLQTYLFPDYDPKMKPDFLINSFWSEERRPQREKIFTRVYFISPWTRQWFFEQGIKSHKIVSQDKKRGQPSFYYRAFLPADF